MEQLVLLYGVLDIGLQQQAVHLCRMRVTASTEVMNNTATTLAANAKGWYVKQKQQVSVMYVVVVTGTCRLLRLLDKKA